jgi:signal transduction histidine kinase
LGFALQDADRRKDEFLAMLAHGLCNPLAPIDAAAELLQLVKLDEARVRQTSQIIGRQVYTRPSGDLPKYGATRLPS